MWQRRVIPFIEHVDHGLPVQNDVECIMTSILPQVSSCQLLLITLNTPAANLCLHVVAIDHIIAKCMDQSQMELWWHLPDCLHTRKQQEYLAVRLPECARQSKLVSDANPANKL